MLAPAAASAGSPANDSRFSAQAVTLPASVNGRTTEATLEGGELESECAASTDSVWYSLLPRPIAGSR